MEKQRKRKNKAAVAGLHEHIKPEALAPTTAAQNAAVGTNAASADGGQRLTAAIPVENPYCSCKLTRVRARPPTPEGREPRARQRQAIKRSSSPSTSTKAGSPTTWTTLEQDVPNHLAL